MTKSKLEIIEARLCRGEEVRLGFILAALKASRPLKIASTGRKAAARRAVSSQRLEAAAA